MRCKVVRCRIGGQSHLCRLQVRGGLRALGNKVISGSKRWRQKPKQGYELAILSN